MKFKVAKHSGIIPHETRSTISTRYQRITRSVNQIFWKLDSETAHSFYVGSYGRRTAIDTSDIDILVEIPASEKARFDAYTGNGQSRLLTAVKTAIQNTYPNSNIHADGQVIKINFSDGMKFEILPAFKNDFYGAITYTYPDSNMGGNWLSTNPKAEQEAMRQKNDTSDGLLQATCRHFRYIRDTYFSSYHLSGILIDSFIYTAMGNWKFITDGSSSAPEGDYENTLKNYLNSFSNFPSLNAPGSGDQIDVLKGLDTLQKVVTKIVS